MEPTAARCVNCGQANSLFETACRKCGAALTAWQRMPAAERAKYQCWKCGGMYTHVSQSPNQGSGCIVAALGLLFAPVLIGIPLLIYGFKLMGEKVGSWQCRSCGLTLPG